MQKRYLTLIVISLMLVGCVQKVAKLPKYQTEDGIKDQALLVVKLNNFDYLDIRRIDDGAPGDEYRIAKHNFLFKPFNYAQTMYTLEPGKYYISVVGIDAEQGVYYSAAPGLSKEGEIAYGAFEVKPGEVLYLGDLECQWRSTNKVKKFYVHNKLPDVKKDLDNAGLPALAAKLDVAKFYPKGANVQDIK